MWRIQIAVTSDHVADVVSKVFHNYTMYGSFAIGDTDVKGFEILRNEKVKYSTDKPILVANPVNIIRYPETYDLLMPSVNFSTVLDHLSHMTGIEIIAAECDKIRCQVQPDAYQAFHQWCRTVPKLEYEEYSPAVIHSQN
jgi:hypothetical protein